MRSFLWVAIVLGVAAFVWWTTSRERLEPVENPDPNDAPTRDTIGRYPRSQFYIEHDRFISADEPKTIPGAKADFLTPESEVFGLVVDGHARAYPVPMISYHHVVNDVINGIPVAVTY